MALRDRIVDSGDVATATPATVATLEGETGRTVAGVAGVAVAKVENSKARELVSIAETIADPDGPCPACGSGQWWQLAGQSWHCRECEPHMPLEATTLTLPCHKPQTRPVRDPARLRRMVELACRRLTITPEQLWAELEANGDLADAESLSVKALREVAMSLCVRR